MKKVKLLIILFLLLMMIPKVYAATIVRDNNIPDDAFNNVTDKYGIYLDYNKCNIAITNDNFKIVDNTDIVIYKKPTEDTTYNNPYSIICDNGGYYTDSNGVEKIVDVTIAAASVTLDLPSDNYSDSSSYYYVATLKKSAGIYMAMYARDDDNENVSISPYVANHTVLSVTVLSADGNSLPSDVSSKMLLPWVISDLDVPDRTITSGNGYASDRQYRESIQFNSGFDSTFHVRTNTVLDISEDNKKFSATEATGNHYGATGQKAVDYSTVVAFQTSPTANMEWWGTNCGTFIETNVLTIKILDTTIALDKEVVKVPTKVKAGEQIDYKLTIYNNSNVLDFTNIKLVDSLPGFVYDSEVKKDLAKGERMVVYGHYVLTQSDVDKGITEINNIATVTANTSYTTTSDGQSQTVVGTETKTATASATAKLLTNPKTGISWYILILPIVLCIALIFSSSIYKKNMLRNEI